MEIRHKISPHASQLSKSLEVIETHTDRPATYDLWCKQDQILKTKTKTTGSKQRHLADLTK